MTRRQNTTLAALFAATAACGGAELYAYAHGMDTAVYLAFAAIFLGGCFKICLQDF